MEPLLNKKHNKLNRKTVWKNNIGVKTPMCKQCEESWYAIKGCCYI